MPGARLPEEEGEGIFAEINITPLTDIFLVLLIIFMVTSSVLADAGASAGLRVDLPKGEAHEISVQDRTLVVGITAQGDLVLDGKPVNNQQLTDLFTRAFKENPDTQVVVQADRESFHGRVVEVMELAKKIGLHRLGIATQQPAE